MQMAHMLPRMLAAVPDAASVAAVRGWCSENVQVIGADWRVRVYRPMDPEEWGRHADEFDGIKEEMPRHKHAVSARCTVKAVEFLTRCVNVRDDEGDCVRLASYGSCEWLSLTTVDSATNGERWGGDIRMDTGGAILEVLIPKDALAVLAGAARDLLPHKTVNETSTMEIASATAFAPNTRGRVHRQVSLRLTTDGVCRCELRYDAQPTLIKFNRK